MDTTLECTTASGIDHLLPLIDAMDGDEKHEGAAHSTADVIWVLYDRIMRITPEQTNHPERDRFLLSKGHGPQALYAVLAAKGFIAPGVLPTFGSFDSPLGHHPDRTLVNGVEISSGSLGHGLPIALGVALGLRMRGLRRPNVFCLIGDGELDEGSNYEAIAVAGRLGLDQLTAIVIDNASSNHGWPGGIASRFAVEDWWTTTVNGRDHDALEAAFTAPTDGRPRAVVAIIEENGYA